MFKNMSRWSLGFLLTLLLTLALSACGDNTPTNSPAIPPAATTSAATTAAAAATTAATVTTALATTPATTTAAATSASPTVALASPTVAAITALAPSTTIAVTTAAATSAVSPTTTAKVTASSNGINLTITDDAKRTVKFDKVPKRIVSLAPSNTELLFALGLGQMLVGVDDYSDYPAEAAKIPKIGGYSTTNLEKVVSLSPDLVLAAGITDPKLITSLEERKLTVVVLNPTNLAGVLTDIKLLGQISDMPDASAQVADDFQKRLDGVAARIKSAGTQTPPRVFYELDPTLYTVGPGSFIDDMIKKAGGQNIVTDGSNPYPQLNQEAVISKDPQIILIGDDSGGNDSPDKILTRPGWEGISAVKNKRIVAVSANLVNRPGPRAAQGVEAMAKALYPDLFK